MPPNNAKIYLESWMTMSLKGDYEKNLMSMFFGDIWIIWRCRNKIIFIKKRRRSELGGGRGTNEILARSMDLWEIYGITLLSCCVSDIG